MALLTTTWDPALKNQRCNHFAAFTRQEIVGTASSLGVHGFDANTPRIQLRKPLWFREVQLCATAQQDQLSTPTQNWHKWGFAELFKRTVMPLHAMTHAAYQ